MVLHNSGPEYHLLRVPWGENNHDTAWPPGVTITPVGHSGERASQRRKGSLSHSRFQVEVSGGGDFQDALGRMCGQGDFWAGHSSWADWTAGPTLSKAPNLWHQEQSQFDVRHSWILILVLFTKDMTRAPCQNSVNFYFLISKMQNYCEDMRWRIL